MRANTIALFAVAGLLTGMALVGRSGYSQVPEEPVIRLAEIDIDPHYIEQYKAALREGIEAAVRLEPGVQSLYAVSVKGHPEQVRVFEVYVNQAAYQAHLQTPHFKKYKSATQVMVRSLKLVETDPILLRSK